MKKSFFLIALIGSVSSVLSMEMPETRTIRQLEAYIAAHDAQEFIAVAHSRDCRHLKRGEWHDLFQKNTAQLCALRHKLIEENGYVGFVPHTAEEAARWNAHVLILESLQKEIYNSIARVNGWALK